MVMILGVEVKTLKSTKSRQPSDYTQDTLPKREEVQLRIWEELQEILLSLEVDDYKISAILTCTSNNEMAITFSKGSKEDTLLEEALNDLIGQRVAILKTDSSQQPIVIRSFTAKTEAVTRPALNVFYSNSLERCHW